MENEKLRELALAQYRQGVRLAVENDGVSIAVPVVFDQRFDPDTGIESFKYILPVDRFGSLKRVAAYENVEIRTKSLKRLALELLGLSGLLDRVADLLIETKSDMTDQQMLVMQIKLNPPWWYGRRQGDPHIGQVEPG